MRWSGFTDTELDEFRRFQQLSFDIQQTVRQRLTTGATERDATRWMMGLYRDAGVASFFHLPVALFGDRTTLPDPWDITQFWPTSRALSAGDAVILDAAPIFHGYLVDTSTSFCHAPAAAEHHSATLDDVAYRGTILDAVRAGATFREIAVAVDDQFDATGYRNCHRLHPGEVLGHRVGFVDDVAEPDAHGFAHALVAWFYAQLGDGADPVVPAPTWSDNPGSDHAPADGLWAVEPHLGRGPHGVKWEEILVVQGSDVFWLDDEPPHVTAVTA
jgi:Xaa-Pro aminopeptidase